MNDSAFLQVIVVFSDALPIDKPLVHILRDSRNTYRGINIRILFANGAQTQTFVNQSQLFRYVGGPTKIITYIRMTIKRPGIEIPVGGLLMFFVFTNEHQGITQCNTQLKSTYYGSSLRTDTPENGQLILHQGRQKPWDDNHVIHLMMFPFMEVSMNRNLLLVKN